MTKKKSGFGVFLQSAANTVKAATDAALAALRPPPPLTTDQLEELQYREEVNRAAARRRAERARTYDALFGGQRWVPRRMDWFK